MLKRKIFVVMAIVGILVVFGCGPMNVGNVPWTLDIQSWSPEQKADFFMTMWSSEKKSYDQLNAMANKPESLIKVLKVKYQILENSRQPIRMYATIVKGGGVPDGTSEQQIIDWLTQLQQQLVYSQGGE